MHGDEEQSFTDLVYVLSEELSYPFILWPFVGQLGGCFLSISYQAEQCKIGPPDGHRAQGHFLLNTISASKSILTNKVLF